MRSIEENSCANVIGDRTNSGNRVRREVEACADRDQLRSHTFGESSEPSEVDGVALRVDRALVDVESEQASSPGGAMGDVSAHRGRRHDDCVARPASGH
ncbi:MAG: hypothetical protein FD127_949, partial [Acidimicrobiaceae bacterium]